MAATLTLFASERGKGPFIEVEALLALTGNYVQGGITLDLTQLYGQTDPAGRSIDSDLLPLWISVESKAAKAAGIQPNIYQASTYTNPEDGTPAVKLTPATVKLQVFLGVTEAATAAFTNDVLSDRIIMKAVFKSQQ